jgi:type II secretory pathway predicted ATPase ExeA
MSSHLIELSKAFGNTSDPHYLFQSQTHANALNLLAGGTEESGNIRVLIGGPGMGKTILLLHLLGRFRQSALTAHLFWTQLGRGEFLHYFLHELGALQPPMDIAQARRELTRVLEREFSIGREVVVGIDEAHDLEMPALGGLAELLDCDLARSRQLQVILVGLPQLEAKLASPELQRIWDRISAVASLSQLTPEETASYINRRLEVFGYRGDGPFTSEVMATIARLAEGIPRNINNICFAALYLAGRRACTVIDSAMLMEAVAQRKGWVTMQEVRQGSIASSANLRTPQDAASDRHSSGSVQQYISTTDSINPTRFGETSGNIVAEEGWVGDDAMVGVSDNIRRWFGEHRVAWSGTVGELAAILDQPETEVVHTLRANSKILGSFGIAVSVCETVGRTRSVSLRRLEERKQAIAEEASPGLTLPKGGIDARQNFDANSWPAKNPTSHGQPTNGLIEKGQTENASAEAASVSPADQALDLLRANSLQYIVKTRGSGFRWAILALLIAFVALVIALGRTYSPLLKRKSQKSTHGETMARVSAGARTLSGTRPPEEEYGAQPDAGEATKSFQQAALLGDPNAQLELGAAYALGRGVPADPVTGYTWLTLALANGDQEAETLIRDLTRKLNQSEIARIRWNLGEMYANGVGVHPDKVTAYMWHLLAESAGETRSTVARSHLASTMTHEERSEANARASQWLRRHHN